ncbi:hypothetical protein FSP39_014956 [Pinctada imbricata]|uniref:Major facilitator superfamily (MFS) profile domain-containing protein n=1 Tax=Pinctada imbricata TaxID=66713 RepID=A0AA88YEL9_PINIB|nr:hypothetical protein FSP39_014956 [Pinctada imbricata]
MDSNTDVDDVLKSLGTWGKYQTFQLALSTIGIWPSAFQLLSIVFTGYRPDFECDTDQIDSTNITNIVTSNISFEVRQCDVTLFRNSTNSTTVSKHACKGYLYSIPKDRSFVTEWDLVCDRSALAEFSQTLAMIGQAIGATVCTSLADRFGRKTITVSSHLCILTLGIAIAFSPNYTVFAILRFFIGIFQQGIGMAGAILNLEIIPMENRYIVEILGQLTWTTGVALVTAFGYFLRDYSWRYTHIAISLFSCYSIIQYWIQEESIRWLIINNKLKEAERIVRKAARWNNVKYDDVIKRLEILKEKKKSLATKETLTEKEEITRMININADDTMPQKACLDMESQTSDVEYLNVTHIFREKIILFNSLILWFAWVTDSLTYYGLTLTSTSLAGDRFVNYLITALVEYPAVFIEFFILNRYLFDCLHGFFSVTDGNSSLITSSRVFTFLGKMTITGAFSTIFLYTPELYPTNLRNVGLGLSSAISRLGGMVAPFAGILAMYISWGPGAAFGIMCVIVSLLCLYLPETRGFELPQTIEELKQWYRQHSGKKRKDVAVNYRDKESVAK